MMCWFLLVPARVPALVSLSSLFFLFSGKGFCSIMICWLLLVPAQVRVVVSLLLSSFLSQEMEFVPSWSWFLLVPARVPVNVSLLLSSCFSQEWFRGFSWFGLRFRCLSPFLLSSFYSSERGSVPSWCPGSFWFRLGFRNGFRCLFPFFSLLSFLRNGVSVPPWFPGSWWFRLWCRCLSLFFFSSFFSQEMVFCFLVPARVPVLVSLLLSSFFLRKRGSVPSWFAGCSWFRLRFGWLSPFLSLLFFQETGLCSIMICWFLLVPARVPVNVSLLSFVRTKVLFQFNFLVSPRSGSGSGAYVPSSPFFSFSQENGFVPPRLHCSVSTQASCVPFFDFIPDQWISKWTMNEGKSQLKWSMNFELHMTFLEAWIGAVWGLCWCNW